MTLMKKPVRFGSRPVPQPVVPRGRPVFDAFDPVGQTLGGPVPPFTPGRHLTDGGDYEGNPKEQDRIQDGHPARYFPEFVPGQPPMLPRPMQGSFQQMPLQLPQARRGIAELMQGQQIPFLEQLMRQLPAHTRSKKTSNLDMLRERFLRTLQGMQVR